MRLFVFICVMLAGFCNSPAVAQTHDSSLESFKTEIVNTYRNPNPESIRKLLHPASSACMQAEPKYERYILKAETRGAIPAEAKISVEGIAATDVLPYRGFKFPVRPSHIVRMEFGQQVSSRDRSTTSQVADKYIARSDNRWYLIMPCPTPEGISRLREMGLLD